MLLENVRNLAGPRHAHEWQVIIETLRDEGYRVSETPAVFSPHLLPPERAAGRRFASACSSRPPTSTDGVDADLTAEPVALAAPVAGWDPQTWDLEPDLA